MPFIAEFAAWNLVSVSVCRRVWFAVSHRQWRGIVDLFYCRRNGCFAYILSLSSAFRLTIWYFVCRFVSVLWNPVSSAGESRRNHRDVSRRNLTLGFYGFANALYYNMLYFWMNQSAAFCHVKSARKPPKIVFFAPQHWLFWLPRLTILASKIDFFSLQDSQS